MADAPLPLAVPGEGDAAPRNLRTRANVRSTERACVSLSHVIERAHTHRDTTSGSIGLVSRETWGHNVFNKVPLPYQ